MNIVDEGKCCLLSSYSPRKFSTPICHLSRKTRLTTEMFVQKCWFLKVSQCLLPKRLSWKIRSHEWSNSIKFPPYTVPFLFYFRVSLWAFSFSEFGFSSLRQGLGPLLWEWIPQTVIILTERSPSDNSDQLQMGDICSEEKEMRWAAGISSSFKSDGAVGDRRPLPSRDTG